MAIYRNISMNFWTDTKVVDDFTPEDKYFMLYCLTNSYTNLCGCYEISIKQMVRDTGYNEETILKLLERFDKKHNILKYNVSNKELYIKNWYKYNWTKSEKLDKPLLSEIKSIKTSEFKKILCEFYNSRDTVSIPYTYTMDTTDTDTDTDTITDNIYNYNNLNNKKKKKKSKDFIPPTLEEIQKYCEERNNDVDYQKFYDYYTFLKWKDSNGKQIKSWKLKVITWENNSKKGKMGITEILDEAAKNIV